MNVRFVIGASIITTEKSWVQERSMTSFDPVDLDWPSMVPNVSVHNEYYLILHVHIHTTSKNTEVRKLQALDALRGATSAWHDPSYDIIGHRSWGAWLWKFQGRRDKNGWEVIDKIWWHLPCKNGSYSWKKHGVLYQPAKVKTNIHSQIVVTKLKLFKCFLSRIQMPLYVFTTWVACPWIRGK